MPHASEAEAELYYSGIHNQVPHRRCASVCPNFLRSFERPAVGRGDLIFLIALSTYSKAYAQRCPYLCL